MADQPNTDSRSLSMPAPSPAHDDIVVRPIVGLVDESADQRPPGDDCRVDEVVVGPGGTIAFSHALRVRAGLLNGVALQVEVQSEGIFLRWNRDPAQNWFWSPEWIAKELEAEASMAAGAVGEYFDDEDQFSQKLAE